MANEEQIDNLDDEMTPDDDAKLDLADDEADQSDDIVPSKKAPTKDDKDALKKRKAIEELLEKKRLEKELDYFSDDDFDTDFDDE